MLPSAGEGRCVNKSHQWEYKSHITSSHIQALGKQASGNFKVSQLWAVQREPLRP